MKQVLFAHKQNMFLKPIGTSFIWRTLRTFEETDVANWKLLPCIVNQPEINNSLECLRYHIGILK